jgi:hypothetical protein
MAKWIDKRSHNLNVNLDKVFFIDLFVDLFSHGDVIDEGRGGRVVEGARLESVYTFTGIGGSNPFLSALNI